MSRLAVLASGDGSNFEAIVGACRSGRLPAEVVGVCCNRPGAGVVARAERLAVDCLVLDHRDYAGRHEHEAAVRDWLVGRRADWILLAGYLRLLTPGFVAAYRGRILNIHPADTRKHQGVGGYSWAVASGLRETAATVHFVDEGLDSGPIVLQEAVPIWPGDTVETLTRRGLQVEHELYVRALGRVLAQSGSSLLKTGSPT